MIGQTISHYKITAKLGEGGMGVVYRAEDTKLKRPVALKFIAANLIKDSDARKRFEREATAAAGVSHANVCHVYEIADADGHTFLAMEFIEGESLDRKIERGPLPLKDALDLARQTADGLAAAHGKGVVHRDIKPANLLITPAGQVKILDFGLALLTEGSKLTQLDTKVGTVAYMSPEQAQGMPVDHRTDIWALGCVLYEMVCGQRPFRGQYDQALFYEIVNEVHEPLTALRAGVPMELEVFVAKCLEKDPGRRYSDVAELAKDLRSLGEKLNSGRSTVLRTATARAAAEPHPLARYRVIEQRDCGAGSVVYDAEDTELGRTVALRVLPSEAARDTERKLQTFPRLKLALAATSTVMALAAAAALWLWLNSPQVSERPLRKFAFTPPGLVTSWGRTAAISPNGKHIVYVAEDAGTMLWVRDLDSDEPRPLAGTDGALRFPFWSPDSRYVGFSTETELKKIAISGGAPITLCEVNSISFPFTGGLWSKDGESIFFSTFPASGDAAPQLFRVPARGGEPLPLARETGPKGGGNTVPSLWTGGSTAGKLVFEIGNAADHDICVKDLATDKVERIVQGAVAAYSPSGHLIYQTSPLGGGLWALPFSNKEMRSGGEPFPIAQRAGGASVSDDGTLVYTDVDEAGGSQLSWYDREGRRVESFGRRDFPFIRPELSPDARRVAVYSRDRGFDVWVNDIELGTNTRLARAPEEIGADGVWSPRGGEVAFRTLEAGDRSIVIRTADGSREGKAIKGAASNLYDWSPDGQHLAYGGDGGIWMADPSGASDPFPFLPGGLAVGLAQLSPAGRYVAYCSRETGPFEVYVTSFPGREQRKVVSTGGGSQPRWSRDGKELFYVNRERDLMAVPVSLSPELAVGRAKRLFRHPNLAGTGVQWQYDVHPNGRRFLVVEPNIADEPDRKPPSIHVVENWHEEFRGREKN